MNLDEFIITCFCLTDEMVPMAIKTQQLWARGSAPKLSDNEVISLEVVGSYLDLSEDRKMVFEHFSGIEDYEKCEKADILASL